MNFMDLLDGPVAKKVTEKKVTEKKVTEKKLKPLEVLDEYPKVWTKRFLVRDEMSYLTSTPIKQWLEVILQRVDDDNTDEGFYFIWIHMYQESKNFTGYLKDKSIYLPLKNLEVLSYIVNDLAEWKLAEEKKYQ